MSEDFLSLGDRVVVIENELHPEFIGQYGVIEELGASFHFWVLMPDGIMYGFNDDELELAPADEPPAQAGEASEPYTQYLVDRQRVWDSGHAATDFQTWRIGNLEDQLVSSQALAATNASLLANAQSELDTRLRELMLLEGERNRLRAQLAAVTGELKLASSNWIDCANALGEVLKERGVGEMTVGGYYFYEAAGGGAGAWPVDADGKRVYKQADGEG